MSVMGKIVPHVSSRNFGRINAALCAAKANRTYFTYTQELSQPLDRKPEFVTAKEAFEKCLKSGKYTSQNFEKNRFLHNLSQVLDITDSDNFFPNSSPYFV